MHLSDTFAEALGQALWCVKSGYVAYAGYRRRSDFMLLAFCTVFVFNRELTINPGLSFVSSSWDTYECCAWQAVPTKVCFLHHKALL